MHVLIDLSDLLHKVHFGYGGTILNTLSINDIALVFHIAPLHYLPFIARSKSLKSKVTLRGEGFAESHFRSKSKHLDAQRGFGDYIHLSTVNRPPILAAKLSGGFPHICLSVPATVLDGVTFDLCRYNVAMSRQLRRDGKPGFPEGPGNGSYYGHNQLPIARTEMEQTQLLQSRNGEMLEVLVKPPIALPNGTQVTVFNGHDRAVAMKTLEQLNVEWAVSLANAPDYQARPEHSDACEQFIDFSLADEIWRGNGLEFDRV